MYKINNHTFTKSIFKIFFVRGFGKFLSLLSLIFLLFPFSFLKAQDTLEEIVTWELDEGINFLCANSNKEGGDLNNDGYDDFIHISYNSITGEKMFQFYFGSSNPGTQPDLIIPTETYVNLVPSWGGDLNGNG